MAISTATHGSIERPRTAVSADHDHVDAELEALLPRSTESEARGRWFDLCFRLIILALAALWLFAPPAGTERIAADEKAVATTR